MELITIPIRESVDLSAGTKTVTLPYPLIRGDDEAHEIVLKVTSGGAPVALTGATAKCYAVLSDMASTIIAEGTVSGNEARATFSEAFYSQNGRIDIIMRLRMGSVSMVPLRIIATVQSGITDTIIDPSHIIPSLDELLAQIDRMKAGTAAATTAATSATAAASEASKQAAAARSAADRAGKAANSAEDAADVANTAAATANDAAGRAETTISGAEAAATAANAAAGRVEDSIAAATQAAQSADASAGAAALAAAGANAAASNAGAKAGLADTAAGAANTAAANADAKAGLAELAAEAANSAAGRADGAAAKLDGLTVSEENVPPEAEALIPSLTLNPETGAYHLALQVKQGATGETGPRGEPGDGVRILGTYETAEALAAAVTDPAQGDMYNVGAEPPYTVYMWDTALAPPGWRELGKITSPPTVHVGPGEPRNGELVWVDTDAPATGTTGADIAVSAEDGRTIDQAIRGLGELAGEAGNRVRDLTAAELSGLDLAARAALYAEGTRLLKVVNGETVTLHGVRGDGSLDWLGSNRPVVNLLDNGDFAIAQAGYGGSHGGSAYVYAADRWFGDTAAAYSAASGGGLTIDNTAGGARTRLFQICGVPIHAMLGRALTLAVRRRGKPALALSAAVPDQVPAESLVLAGRSSGDGMTAQLTYIVGQHGLNVRLQWEAGLTETLDTCALYEGTYTADTLPPYAPKGYAAELIACRRYYRPLLKGGFDGCLPCTIVNDSKLEAQLDLDPPMRAKPTLVNALNANGRIVAILGSFSPAVRNIGGISASAGSEGTVLLYFTLESALPAGVIQTSYDALPAAGTLALSADL